MIIRYLRNVGSRNHVSNDLIGEFENVVIKECSVRNVRESAFTPLFLYLNFKLPSIKLPLYSKEITFSMLMGVGDFRYYIKLFKCHKYNAVYLFDAWPIYYDYIKFACNSLNIKYLFCSSQIATTNLSKIIKNTKVIWQPEAIDISLYKQKCYTDRQIDVLQFGRNYKSIQEQLITGLSEKCIKYIYQDKSLVFPTRSDFIGGLASSKISICFPRSLTNPEVASTQETMTARYLQSMASKTLVVGKCPQEMMQLFSYNPVIELDLHNPVDHIEYLLDNYENYIPLIERNYNEVLHKHQWENRWNSMKTELLCIE